MLSKLTAVFLLYFCLTSRLSAQEGLFALNFLVGQPRGEFEDNVEDLGFGIGGLFAFRPGNSPILLGMDVDFAIYGNETRRVPFSETIPDVTVEVQTSNNILLFHALARLQGNQGRLRPYMDGLVGMHYLFTETKVRDEDSFDDNDIASSTNQQDVTFSYGAGGGIMIEVYENKNLDQEGLSKLKRVFVDFRVRYSFGGQATYLKEGSITRDGGSVSIDAIRSNTDLLTYHLGFAISF